MKMNLLVNFITMGYLFYSILLQSLKIILYFKTMIAVVFCTDQLIKLIFKLCNSFLSKDTKAN